MKWFNTEVCKTSIHRFESGRRLHALCLTVLLLALSACAPPAPAGLAVSNGTTLTVTLVVNGSPKAEAQAGRVVALEPNELPSLPWLVQARTPTGRQLLEFEVREGDVVIAGNSSRSVGRRVDLSCGRLDVYSGAPMGGPPPQGEGVLGDCDP